MAKKPNIKADPNEPDPADAFARVPTIDAIPDDESGDMPPTSDAPPADEKPSRSRKKKGDRPRQPTIEMVPADDDEGMDPADMADEIVGTMDSVFALVAGLRGYTLLLLPDGSMMLQHVMPDERSKARLKKALTRVTKSVGANMSPAAGAAWAAFSCYGAPVIALEMAKASAKKQAKG